MLHGAQRHSNRWGTVVVCASLTYAAAACAGESLPQAAWPTQGWRVSTAEAQGMDSGALADFVDDVVAAGGIDAVVVTRNGWSVVDTAVYPFTENTAHAVHSCTKSVIGTLIGIAIDRGLLAGVDVPVIDVLAGRVPPTTDETKASMTVEHLLTMSTGLDCRDSYLHEWRGLIEMTASDDWVAHVLELPMSEEPGTKFEYCNGASMLLSAILTEVTGMPASEFAAEALFEPLGITDFSWPASPSGDSIGWSELRLSAPDLAKIGLLYLRDGEWDGVQVVSREWIEAATAPHIASGTLADHYGYHWWIDDSGAVMALGFGGQHLIVLDDLDVVVVFVAVLLDGRFSEPEAMTNQGVVAAIRSDSPLPANAEDRRRLELAVDAARSGPAPVAPALPATASAVDGARYELQVTPLDLTAISFMFGDDTAVVELENPSGTDRVEIGLDGRFVTNEDPGGQRMALRGTWHDDHVFVIDYHHIGEVDRGTWTLRFDGRRVEADLGTGDAGQLLVGDRVD